MSSHSAAERAALVDALSDAGPHRPTLCAGWTTTELAAHLVARERRPDSGPGIMIPALAGWTDRVRRAYARRPYPDLVQAIRTGPPWTSVLALPGLDARVNLLEHFVHCEDVRRAYAGEPGWEPRELPAERQAAIWAQLGAVSRRSFRRSPVLVGLRTPDGRSTPVSGGTAVGDASGGGTAGGGEPVVIVGDPGELALYLFGRKDHARVQLEGPDDAVNTFRRLTLRV